MSLLKQHIEALIFCSEQSISLEEIQASLQISMGWEVKDEEMLQALEEIKQKYVSEDFPFELCEISDGYQFLTKKEFHSTVSALIQHKAKKKLSIAQMETLAIIAYKQPISRTEVEHIRGVNCDYAIQKLLEKDLIEIQGKGDGPGKPIIYATSQTFMDYFGIKSVRDLPQLKDLHPEQNEIGTPNDMIDAGQQEEKTEQAEIITPSAATEEAKEIVIEITDSEETVIVDQNLPVSVPDRKAIFREHSEKETSDENNQGDNNLEESKSKKEDDDSYS